MLATRARIVALLLAGPLTLALGCGSAHTGPDETPTVSRTPTARDTTLLPSTLPPGFHIAGVELASADEDPRDPLDYAGRLLTLYGDPDLEDPLTGPALVVGRDWGEDQASLGCQTGGETDARSKRGPVVACAGALWVSWENPTTDYTEEYVGVMGRDVSPELVARATDALNPPMGAIGVPHQPLTIPTDVLPPGMKKLASGPVWEGSSDIHSVREDTYLWKRRGPSARIEMRVTDASDELSLLTRVDVGGTFRRIRGGPGAVHSQRDTHLLTWREGEFLVAVEAHGIDRVTVDAFVRSLRKVPIDKSWKLKDSILTSPPVELLAPGERLAASGSVGKVRWAVGIDDGWETVHIHHADHGDIGGSGATIGRVKRGQILTNRSEFDYGELVIAHVHADVAKVVATTQEGQEIDLPLGESVLPDKSRYCGVWLDRRVKLKHLTTYDVDGDRIARVTLSL